MMNYHNQATDHLFEAILSLKTLDECYQFFEDACTIKEILDIAERFAVAKMLSEKNSYTTITKETGMSTATISRVNRCLLYGTGGYRMAIERTKKTDSPQNDGND